jgi:predicted ABC-type transport system involved in lysophospholipase L1 biosynthesis ATPase subunit
MVTNDINSILKTRDLTKTYESGGHHLTVLDKVSIDVPQGATAAIVGPSGSGKTTLLGLCAGLDRATSGTVNLMIRTFPDMTRTPVPDCVVSRWASFFRIFN